MAYSRYLKFSILILSFSILAFAPALAQGELQKNETKLSSPSETVYQHLVNLQEESYNPGLAAKTLDIADPSSKRAKKLAIKLIKILDGKGLYVEVDEIPKSPDYMDSVSKKQRYVLFNSLPEVYVVKKGDKWLYSKETVAAIPRLYEEVYPFQIDQILSDMPGFFREKAIGLEIWQYIGLLIYLVVAFVFYRIFAWIFGKFIIRLISRFSFKDLAGKYIKRISREVSLLLVFLLLTIFLPILQLPVGISVALAYALKVLTPTVVTIIAYRLTDFFADILNTLASKTKTTVDDNMVPLARKTMKIVVIVFGGIFILQSVDISVTPLLAGISIGGLAFALAAQDTVKNLLGSLTIFADQPFEVGDWIVFDGTEGTVIEVGLRSTRVRTFYDSIISIPNGKLADIKIDNMGRRDYRRYSTKISLTYDTPAEKLEAYVEGLKEINKNHPNTRKEGYQIHLNEFGEKAIQVLFYVFFEVPDWTKELEARQELILQAKQLAEELDIRLAYPIRDYSKLPPA